MKKLLAVAVAMSAYACVAFAQGSPDLDHLARLRAEGIGVGTPVVPIDLIFGEGIFVAPVTITGQMQGETLGKAKFEVVFSALGSAAAGPLVSGARTTALETAPSGFCGWGTGSLNLTVDDGGNGEDDKSTHERGGTITADLLGSSCNGVTFTTTPFRELPSGPVVLNVNYHITGGTGRFANAEGVGHLDVTITSITPGSRAYAHMGGNIACEFCNSR
jgi:hypothetical protein